MVMTFLISFSWLSMLRGSFLHLCITLLKAANFFSKVGKSRWGCSCLCASDSFNCQTRVCLEVL